MSTPDSKGSYLHDLIESRLVLADGSVFEGDALGAPAVAASGEVVFNTVLSGYQEVITDPSYAGQMITFTYPHIGNYGTAAIDDEAQEPFCRGVIIREMARRRSSWRSEDHLDTFLRRHGVPAIAGIDTRRLTRHIRDRGAMPGAFGTADFDTLLSAANNEKGTAGVDLVSVVTTDEIYTVGSGPRTVVCYDLGVKATMLRSLGEIATVTVVPADTPAEDIMVMDPDGVFLSNGPGDPEQAGAIVGELPKLIGMVPIFGICLGHQVLSLALGGRTYKMKFGHHGGNVPVRDARTGKVEITSQNHNFAVESGSVPGVTETHVCLNDGALEGLVVNDAPAFSVQYHPEAGPGPHDSRYLFDEFAELMDSNKSLDRNGAS
ncbi:MAG: glutamine-hydrolyzing carbamoyl-phosphate synthase small subunit [Actinomycetia bacterium]|nr:glutamine-hydrolyzing carbamoyl-phosphate synthase small subunit [Actinomycetes bacterium]